MHESALQCVDGCLGTVARAHLIKNGGNVNPHGFIRNAELLGNFAIGTAPRDVGKHFRLTRREAECRDALGEQVKRNARQIALPAFGVLNSGNQLLAARILGEIGHDAGANRTVDVFAALVVGEHYDARPGILRKQVLDDLKAAHTRQAQVEHHHVGPPLAVQGHSLFAICRLPDDADLRMGREHSVKRGTRQKVIFHQQHTDDLHVQDLPSRLSGARLFSGCWKALCKSRKGTLTETFVPPLSALETRSVPPILRARSSITAIPKWPALATSERNPQPLSAMERYSAVSS